VTGRSAGRSDWISGATSPLLTTPASPTDHLGEQQRTTWFNLEHERHANGISGPVGISALRGTCTLTMERALVPMPCGHEIEGQSQVTRPTNSFRETRGQNGPPRGHPSRPAHTQSNQTPEGTSRRHGRSGTINRLPGDHGEQSGRRGSSAARRTPTWSRRAAVKARIWLRALVRGGLASRHVMDPAVTGNAASRLMRGQGLAGKA